MNVASLELSRELYELSGWDDTYFVWNNKTLRTKPTLDKEWRVSPRYNTQKQALESFTAYDLGYLLRKLPQPRSLSETYLDPRTIGWEASWKSSHVRADTPEDAACKLAIELFKRGILTK